LRPIERRRRIRQLALAMVEITLAAADAAEVESQHREAALGERIIEVVDDLIVHRPAELRVRMQNHRDGGAALLGRVEPPLKPSSRTGENDFRHRRSNSAPVAGAAPPVRLKILRNRAVSLTWTPQRIKIVLEKF